MRNGAHGALNGKVGNLVSYQLKGKTVVRQVGVILKKPSIPQLAVRQRVKVINQFLNPIKEYITSGFSFEVIGTDRHAHNEATSYNLKNATAGEYPNIHIDYSKVKVSIGNLLSPDEMSATRIENALEITWTYDNKRDYDFRNDRAMIILYYAKTNEAYYILSGSARSDGKQTIELDSTDLMKACNIYLSFFADNRGSVSDSKHQYIEELV